MGVRKYGYLFSGTLLVIALLLIVFKGPKLGVDFSGGALVWVKFEQPMDVGTIRKSLANVGEALASIQKLSGTNEFVIRSSSRIDLNKFVDNVLGQLKKDFPDNPAELRSKETVEPKISRELTRNTVYAVLLALALMGIYVWFRFDYRFGVCSAVSLFHDITITVGALVLTGREFTIPVIGALLTILGYSINDTIIVSDRVREDIKKMRSLPLKDVLNLAINETLSRTTLTVFTVIITLFCLFFFGGPVIADFAFTLIVGLIFGTYSSTFVVCALVTDWEEKFPKKKSKK
jgi:preprotein translocase subunit SecF